jgi:hypothetical protein
MSRLIQPYRAWESLRPSGDRNQLVLTEAAQWLLMFAQRRLKRTPRSGQKSGPPNPKKSGIARNLEVSLPAIQAQKARYTRNLTRVLSRLFDWRWFKIDAGTARRRCNSMISVVVRDLQDGEFARR